MEIKPKKTINVTYYGEICARYRKILVKGEINDK